MKKIKVHIMLLIFIRQLGITEFERFTYSRIKRYFITIYFLHTYTNVKRYLAVLNFILTFKYLILILY